MSSIDEQVIDFYYELFDHIFTQPFRPLIRERLRKDAVARQVEEAAGAASQALTRFFVSEQLTVQQVTAILGGFRPLSRVIKLPDIANPNRTPEALVEHLLQNHACPAELNEAGSDAVYRVALHLTVQVLMLVGPVMTEWQRLTFSTTYEMPRRIVTQLNQITEGLKAFSSAGQAAVDERYELAYRDHLLQRFYRVEAGTVRMTTNLNVDLRELFVMPQLIVRRTEDPSGHRAELDADVLMNLSAARAFFQKRAIGDQSDDDREGESIAAIEQVRSSMRNVLVGVPGSGKSTFLEWLQLSVANVDEELIGGGEQAIPLLLRVRQLDPKNLPKGAELVEKATGSRDRASLMPAGWLDRQMKAGRVLFMLDGLDETEPGLRDAYILPWLEDLCASFPSCLFLVSSRPVGYPSGRLQTLQFSECELRDFREPEIAEYSRHWCTAIRLAQNEPDEEARREGAKEGDQIVAGFMGHPYIGNLARNPLMLSAICLVNYFEGGQLPKDRAMLYKLCVEGLLHHWDHRRGIRSEFSLTEKLRVSREVAIAMQADDRAEYEAAKVLHIFAVVLNDQKRAKQLLEHIRYRTGLLIERRAGVFAFAHLTFQEYLAACAVYEGNRLNIGARTLAQEHSDSRWKEVIALYCGLAPTEAARRMIEDLIIQPDSLQIAEVLAESFLSSSSELLHVVDLRSRLLTRIAVAPCLGGQLTQLDRFSPDEVRGIANAECGRTMSDSYPCEAYMWLLEQPANIDKVALAERLTQWRALSPVQIFEVLHLIHSHGTDEWLAEVAVDSDLYESPGPHFGTGFGYETQAEIASFGLARKLTQEQGQTGPGLERALLQVLRVILQQSIVQPRVFHNLQRLFHEASALKYPIDPKSWPEFISLTRQLADAIEKAEQAESKQPAWKLDSAIVRRWADRLEMKTQAKNSRMSATKNSSKRRRKA